MTQKRTLWRPVVGVAGIGLSMLLLAGCSDVPRWLGGGPTEIKRAPGERMDVLPNSGALQADPAVADVTVVMPEQTNLEAWTDGNSAMRAGHIGLSGLANTRAATIGSGFDFSRQIVSPPVVSDGRVFAMDAAGVISAHNESAIDEILWTDEGAQSKRLRDVLGGGLAYAQGVLYATRGDGVLQALDAVTGQLKWRIAVGAPVRGAPAVAEGLVVVLTADNQTLAYEAVSGQPRWEHRGIRETAGYFSVTSPVVSEGIVVAAYSSGELFALRLETGSVLWSDTLAGGQRTRASAALGGIDANPVVQEGVVVATSASGQMQASALINGRPLWQVPVGSHMTPWSAGNALFVVSDTHDIAAILKPSGAVRWASSLARRDPRDASKDKTPPLYGPILSGNTLLVVDGEGTLTSFKPTTGERISSYSLESGIVSAPVIANGAMYVVTRDARLVKYW